MYKSLNVEKIEYNVTIFIKNKNMVLNSITHSIFKLFISGVVV